MAIAQLLQLRPLGVQVIDRQRVVPAAWYKKRRSQYFACFLATIRTRTIMKKCSRRRRADAPQRWTDKQAKQAGRMKRRLLNLPLMKGLLDVLPVGLSPPLLHPVMPPLPSFCREPPRRTTPPDEVCELGELTCIFRNCQLDACSPLRGLHFS
jgi:hypothetical protein